MIDNETIRAIAVLLTMAGDTDTIAKYDLEACVYEARTRMLDNLQLFHLRDADVNEKALRRITEDR